MKVITVPCLFDNYAYILENSKNAEAAVVDPSEAWPIMRELDKRGLALTTVFCTHHHNDHIGGIDDLLEVYDDLRIIGFGQDQQRISHITEPLEDGGEFFLWDTRGQLYHTPGHTTNSVVYHLDDCLFTGDTMFGAGCGRLFEGTPGQMVASLQRISSCSPQTALYFGHEYTALNLRFAALLEPNNLEIQARQQKTEQYRASNVPTSPSLLEEELQTNPFLRVTEPELMAYLKEHHALQADDPESVFTLVRELRNTFS